MTQPTPATPVAAPPGTDYPGKTLGIVGLVLSIVVGGIVGIIVSAIALSQSKAAGYKNTPAKAGIIIGIIVLALWIIGVILFSVTLATVGNVTTY